MTGSDVIGSDVIGGDVTDDGVFEVETPFESVPAAPDDAELDPHWTDLRAGQLLPPAYMPPAMAGSHGSGMRIVVWVLITVFLTATTLGTCLTYGPGN